MLTQAVKAWSELDLASRRSEWDEVYGHIVTNKENGVTERQQLVTHVKEFATAFKADPSTDRVEALLRYMKRFINALYERIEVSEDGFINLYQKIALIDDPAPVLKEAQSQFVEKSRRITQLEQQLKEAQDILTSQAANAAEAVRAQLTEEADASNKQLLAEYQRQIAALERETSLLKGDRDRLRRAAEQLQTQLTDEQLLSSTTASVLVDHDGDVAADLASAARKLSDDRVNRLQCQLDVAQAEVDRLCRVEASLLDEVRTARRAQESAEAELRTAKETAQRSAPPARPAIMAAESMMSSMHTKEPPTPTLSTASYIRRIAELETSLRHAGEELAAAREQLGLATTAAFERAAIHMTAGITTPPPPHSVAITMPTDGGSSKSAAGRFLTDADFSLLLTRPDGSGAAGGGGGIAASAAGATAGTPVHAGADTASTQDSLVQALQRQRDALKRQLADAQGVIAQLKYQRVAPQFPQVVASRPAQGRCENCNRAFGSSARDAPATLPAANDAHRKRDVAITALDRVGAMLGSMLQVSRAARIGVALYLLTLHFVVFSVVMTWSSHSMHRASVPPRRVLSNLVQP
jgi:hypothetical protein